MHRPRPPASWVESLPSPHAPSQGMVLEALRTAVLSGRVRPGTLIALDDIAARFAVSRIPVREALKTLVGEGLVDHEPRGGYRVARLTRAELGELYLVRASLEAAAQAAAIGRATAADDEAAAAALGALEAATAGGDTSGHHRWSRSFHLALLAPCRMHRLLRMFEAAWNTTEPGQPMSHASPTATAALAVDHRRMLAAFTARDGEQLVAVTAEHYRRLQDVVAVIPEE